jgi:hypothetical protein
VFACSNIAFNGDLAAGRCDLRLGKHNYHNHKDGIAPERIGGWTVVTCDLGSMITTITRAAWLNMRVILKTIPVAKGNGPTRRPLGNLT